MVSGVRIEVGIIRFRNEIKIKNKNDFICIVRVIATIGSKMQNYKNLYIGGYLFVLP